MFPLTIFIGIWNHFSFVKSLIGLSTICKSVSHGTPTSGTRRPYLTVESLEPEG
uniref:Uncharacterized protein n=1 Tax=Anguilla anguilla TaxID=7936 RepID=A0A0E9UJS9_ANGAN